MMLDRRSEKLVLKAPDGQKIRGVYSWSSVDKTAPVVVFAHGLGSNHRGEKSVALEAECAHRGWAFAACDFRGHGASDGTMLELRGSRLIEDLELIIREALNRGAFPVYLFGSSMGGWASSWFAAKHPGKVAGAAFVAPAFRFLEWKRLTESDRNEWRRAGCLRVRNEFIDVEIDYAMAAEAMDFQFEILVAEFHTPSIIFHGMKDEIAHHSLSIEFAERCSVNELELILFKNGDHRMNRDKERLAFEACEFFARYKRPPAPDLTDISYV